MTSARLRTILLTAFSLVLALAAPLAVWLLLRPDGPIGAVLTVLAAFTVLSLVRRRFPSWGARAVGVLMGLVYVLAALVLVMYIVVIPFTYYLAWLDLVRSGKPGGIISFLFFVVTAFFAGVFSSAVRTAGPLRAVLGMALVIVFEALVIWQTMELAALFTILVVGVVVILALSFKKPSPRRLALPGALLALAIVISLALGLGSPPNSGMLVKTGLLTHVKRLIVGVFPDLSALSSVAGYGYSFDREDLGRKPVLSSVPLLRVTGIPPDSPHGAVYLRTQIFDEYFNNNWGVSRPLLDRMAGAPAALSVEGPVSGRTVSLTVLFDYVPLLPHTLDTASIILPSHSLAEVEGGDYDIGFALSSPLVRGDVLTLELFGQAALPALPAAEAYNERPAPAVEDQDDLLDRYLQVPSSVTARIRDLAARLSAGEGQPAATIGNIVDFLNGRYLYSLDTELPPKGDEFTDHFLFVTRRGFCVHFATTFVMLARLNHIPARYATGFLAYYRPAQQDAIVTGYNAHAWPEVRLPGRGWVTMEATPALNPANVLIPDYYRFFNPGQDPLTARQLEAFMSGQIALPRPAQPGLATVFASLLPVLPWTAGIVLTVALVIIGYSRLHGRLGKKRLYRGTLRRFNRHLCVLVARMERHNVPAPEEAGWLRWGEELTQKFPEEKENIDALTRAATGVFFARRPAEAGQVELVKRVSRRLRAVPHATVTQRD